MSRENHAGIGARSFRSGVAYLGGNEKKSKKRESTMDLRILGDSERERDWGEDDGFAVCVCVVQCLQNGSVFLGRDGGGKVKETNDSL